MGKGKEQPPLTRPAGKPTARGALWQLDSLTAERHG